jgi:hypothetical protein
MSPSSETGAELGDGLAGDDDVDLVAAGKFELDIHQREAAAIGGHEGELVVLEGKKNAVEHVARLVGRDA